MPLLSLLFLLNFPGIMRWGWISLLVIVLEVYLWTKQAGDQSFVKPLRFHLDAFSGTETINRQQTIIIVCTCKYILIANVSYGKRIVLHSYF